MEENWTTYCYDKLAVTNAYSCACIWAENVQFTCKYNRNVMRRVDKLPELIKLTKHSKKKDKLKKELRRHTEYLRLVKGGCDSDEENHRL